ncbi:TRAP transporter permease [Chloroflexota bacterium]
MLEKAHEVEITRYGNLPRLLKVVFLVLTIAGVGIVVYYLFGFSVRGYALIDAGYYYLIIACYLSCVFLILPARPKDKAMPWYDLVAAALSFGIPFHFFLNAWNIVNLRWVPASPLNFALAIILCLLVLEAGRRAAGPIYLSICIIVGLYPLYAGHMPGILYGFSSPLDRTIALQVFGSEGLLGVPTKVMGDILIAFLIFAGILIATGAGRFFLNLALALLGRFRGGPAKVAVISSGFFGSLSGSILSNVAATGIITIPIMKRTGYPAHYAAAIEACASTGGGLMPPVMGAVAFVMCVFLAIDYAVVMVAAAIPAILYYFGLLMQTDAYAARVGLRGLPREEIPSFKATIKQGWPFLAVLAFLVWGLAYERWAAMSAFYAAGLMVVLSFSNRETMMTPRRIIEACVIVGRLITQTLAILLPIGFIICGLVITGTGPAFTSGVISLAGGNVYLILLLGVIACYLMGMAGLIVPAYIFLALTLAPAVIEVGGLDPLAVHLFIIYYALLASITLPVAAAAFLGATIAGARPMKTALTAMRLGIVIYFIPFLFVFNPALILRGPILESLYLFALCLVGILLIAEGLEGYLLKVGRIPFWVRTLLVLAGFLIAFPTWTATIIGAAVAVLVIPMAIILKRRKGRAEEPAISE